MNSFRRGWCPSLFHPMQTGDGWLCRIKPFKACITSQQAFFIAQAAKRHGNGLINLSQKANLQLRGFSELAIQDFIPHAIDHELCSPTQIQEKKRNILLSPLFALDKNCHPDTRTILALLQQELITKDVFQFPSEKFSLLLDGGGIFSLDRENADINIRNIEKEWFIQIGKQKKLIPCTIETVLPLIQDIVRFCFNHQLGRLIHNQNMEKHLERFFPSVSFPSLPPRPSPSIGKFSLGLHIGIPFGLLTAQELIQLAHLSETHGNAEIHLTPWRSVILPGCSDRVLPQLAHFIIDDQDPRSTIILCPGKPYCIQGKQPVLHDVQKLLPVLGKHKDTIHFSGCTKGCASPKQNPITLCATDKGYRLIINGTADKDAVYKELPLIELINLLKTHFPIV